MVSSTHYRGVLGHGLLILVGLALIGVAVHASSRGLSHYVTSVLEHRLDDWHISKVSVPVSGRRELIEDMDRFSFPSHGLRGDVALMNGRAELLLLRDRLRDHPDLTLVASDADPLDAFREALRLRPAWGRGWARFAQVKAMRDEYDGELAFALGFAVEMAPQEQDVQALVVSTGFNAWDYLPERSKELVWSLALRAMENPGVKRYILRGATGAGLAGHLQSSLRRQAGDGDGATFRAGKGTGSNNAATRYQR